MLKYPQPSIYILRTGVGSIIKMFCAIPSMAALSSSSVNTYMCCKKTICRASNCAMQAGILSYPKNIYTQRYVQPEGTWYVLFLNNRNWKLLWETCLIVLKRLCHIFMIEHGKLNTLSLSYRTNTTVCTLLTTIRRRYNDLCCQKSIFLSSITCTTDRTPNYKNVVSTHSGVRGTSMPLFFLIFFLRCS